MSLSSRLLAAYSRLQRWMLPQARWTQYAYLEAVEPFLNERTVWLDIGCGRSVVPPILEPTRFAVLQRKLESAALLVGVDADLSSLRDNKQISAGLVSDAARLPFSDATFSLVTANMVVEHLREPEPCLREIWRVLKPGGAFVLHTPNTRHYGVAAARLAPDRIKKSLAQLLESRAEQDVFPTCYRLNSPQTIRAAACKAGFELPLLDTTGVFVVARLVLPIAFLELCIARVFETGPMRGFRPDIVAVLRKPEAAVGARAAQA